MHQENEHREPSFGYLSLLESPEHGFFGGYLIISAWGRPLEFHCTAPVRPSRAQQILYGPTLRSYLLDEQIGPVLLETAELTPELVLTDQPAALYLRSQVVSPIILVTGQSGSPTDIASRDDGLINGPSDSSASGTQLRVVAPVAQHSQSSAVRFSVGGCQLELQPNFQADRSRVEELIMRLAQHVDLTEPFGRIHEAIREAQRIGQRSPDAHGHAA